MSIVTIIALVFLIISWVVAVSNKTMPSALEWAVWSIAVIAVLGRVL